MVDRAELEKAVEAAAKELKTARAKRDAIGQRRDQGDEGGIVSRRQSRCYPSQPRALRRLALLWARILGASNRRAEATGAPHCAGCPAGLLEEEAYWAAYDRAVPDEARS